MLGSSVAAVADLLKDYGATNVLVADDSALAQPLADKYAALIASIAKERGSSMVVAAASTFSKDILPRAAALLDAGIVTNRNSIPADPNGAWYTSGIRFGTPALTTRGFGPAEFDRVAELVVEVLSNTTPDGTSKAKYTLVDSTADWVRAASTELLDANPLYPGLTL